MLSSQQQCFSQPFRFLGVHFRMESTLGVDAHAANHQLQPQQPKHATSVAPHFHSHSQGGEGSAAHTQEQSSSRQDSPKPKTLLRPPNPGPQAVAHFKAPSNVEASALPAPGPEELQGARCVLHGLAGFTLRCDLAMPFETLRLCERNHDQNGTFSNM